MATGWPGRPPPWSRATGDDRLPGRIGFDPVSVCRVESNGCQTGLPTTFLLASFYWDNFFGSGPKRGPDGAAALTLPIGKAKLAGIAASDIGAATYGMFKKGGELIRQRIARRSSLIRLSGRRRHGEHVPVLPRFRSRL